MQLFTRLYTELDSTTRTLEKVRALERYFTEAKPEDAVWGLYFLVGRKIKRAVTTRLLRDWLAEEAGVPHWIIDESYDAVGDLAETLALLLPNAGTTSRMPLHELVETRIVPLKQAELARQQSIVARTWRELDSQQRLVWHKLITGEFRVGVARTLVARALANVAGVPPAIMAHRLMGHWEPTAEDYALLMQGDSGQPNPGRPYPFFLAHPLEADPSTLGPVEDWQVEWKWDGIRAQIIRRHEQVLVWSRGEELMTDRFPEIADAGRELPDGTVLDGEIMAWRDGEPLPFATLQLRIGRKRADMKLLEHAPTAFVAYDLLEWQGQDIRNQPLEERRALVAGLLQKLPKGLAIEFSPTIGASSWEELDSLRTGCRQRAVEGLMLKRVSSPYGVGRPRGDWWKWKTDPYSVDAVLIYAQRGSGRRASLYTDYTFGLWHEGQLVPIAKAYSGLTDAEINEVDRFVRRNTLDKHGPVRIVRPELVFELHFEGIQVSKRHKTGLAVRFPRMAHWRKDKKPAEADTLETLRNMARQPHVETPKQDKQLWLM